jgi:hypothetical protein
VVLNHYVLALDVAGFVEAFAERSGLAHGGLGRTGADEAHDRRRRLLRSRRERPRRHAAQRRKEFSSSDVACHVTLRLGVIHAMEG